MLFKIINRWSGLVHCEVEIDAEFESQPLEACVGPAMAGALIYAASCPAMQRVPNFYATNEEALADIARMADEEPELVETGATSEDAGGVNG